MIDLQRRLLVGGNIYNRLKKGFEMARGIPHAKKAIVEPVSYMHRIHTDFYRSRIATQCYVDSGSVSKNI
jgi:hypothetical protein